jgi:hypothetical protein
MNQKHQLGEKTRREALKGSMNFLALCFAWSEGYGEKREIDERKNGIKGLPWHVKPK